MYLEYEKDPYGLKEDRRSDRLKCCDNKSRKNTNTKNQ